MGRINGVFYGAFQGEENGIYTCGSIFSLEPSAGDTSGEQWDETVLYNFPANGGACQPSTPPVPGPGGALYGLAGNLYELQPPSDPGGDWTETVQYALDFPAGNLVDGPAGSFYVLNDGGGAGFVGDLLQMTPPAAPGGPWTGTDLFDFFKRPIRRRSGQPDCGP
jgi:hypothetical protein